MNFIEPYWIKLTRTEFVLYLKNFKNFFKSVLYNKSLNIRNFITLSRKKDIGKTRFFRIISGHWAERHAGNSAEEWKLFMVLDSQLILIFTYTDTKQTWVCVCLVLDLQCVWMCWQLSFYTHTHTHRSLRRISKQTHRLSNTQSCLPTPSLLLCAIAQTIQ